MNKKQRDNRANQLNPNNSAYWKSRMDNSKSSYSGYSSYSSHSSFEEPKFVSKPKKGLFGKVKGEYGWVICDHNGLFLEDVLLEYFTRFFRLALIYSSKEKAEMVAQDILEHTAYHHWLKVRCVELQ